MKPVYTDNTNALAKGFGCEDLPMTKFKGGYETCWELDAKELKEIKRTGKIYISILSDKASVAPMAVAAETMIMIEGEADGAEDKQ